MTDWVLVIPPSVEGKQPYAAKTDEVLKTFRISEAQLKNAIDTGHSLKQHYFDEMEDDDAEVSTR